MKKITLLLFSISLSFAAYTRPSQEACQNNLLTDIRNNGLATSSGIYIANQNFRVGDTIYHTTKNNYGTTKCSVSIVKMEIMQDGLNAYLQTNDNNAYLVSLTQKRKNRTIGHTNTGISSLDKVSICRNYFLRNLHQIGNSCSMVRFKNRNLSDNSSIDYRAVTDKGIVDCRMKNLRLGKSSTPNRCNIGGNFLAN